MLSTGVAQCNIITIMLSTGLAQFNIITIMQSTGVAQLTFQYRWLAFDPVMFSYYVKNILK